MCRMEKKLIKCTLLLCAAVFISTPLFAQKLSTYEQKRYDLAAQTATEIIMEVPDLAIAMGLSGVKKEEFTNKYEEMDFFEGLIQAVGVSVVYAGSADYQSYKVKEIYKTWTEKRRELDKTRTKADEQREQTRRHQEEDILPPRGTKALLLHSIKKDFSKWAEKGEFEKTSELMIRYRDYGAHVFDSICLLYTCGKYSVAFSTEATDIKSLQYDADNETYTMEFTFGENSNPRTITGKASVPIAFAKRKRYEDMSVSSLRIVDGLIVPKEIQVVFLNDETWERFNATFSFDSIAREKSLIVCFSEIGFNENVPVELLSHCINPGEKLKAEKREIFVKDSIAKRERFVRDSIEKRERFIKDSIETRQRFVRDSIAQRERFIIDSIAQRNKEIREANYRYSTWLKSFEQNVDHSYSPYIGGEIYKLINMDGKIKKCSFEGNILTMKCGKKTFSGRFSKKTVKTDMGEVYQQSDDYHKKRMTIANEDGTLVIHTFATQAYDFAILIDRNNVKVYEISDSVVKKLKDAGLLK